MSEAHSDPRIQLACQTIGAVSVVADRTLPPHLLQLIDTRGNTYFAKQHRSQARYGQETHAYLRWRRHLRNQAPELVGRQDSTHTLLLTAVSGRSGDALPPGSAEEERAHHHAGAALRTLHHATNRRSTEDMGDELAGRLRSWVARADLAELLSGSERHLLLQTADELAGTCMDSAICHLDYQPRNWRVGDGFWTFDFEHMRRDARLRDFARLEFRHWQAAPQLREAFFTGYGSRPTDTEQRLLERFGAIEAVTALVRGHEQDDVLLSAHGRTVLSQLS
ncbi:aminoglycoside phosphotransferase [Streptomyces decoyicus]|uniref:aminoglycoside phosphotransferase n=1 Tax=Streptomyces decoyicus TaxID=249567 RepID=UPI00069D3277|nr:aminoglycoside phosphotransferase [Streptomyces decoyicus]KOG50594.1 aminoglycoside phosphotransferase [Streptomyces decoyicus]QZY15188.1 aminoglycoside phosphotransferase family protein [Streptomyces decoyicus]